SCPGCASANPAGWGSPAGRWVRCNALRLLHPTCRGCARPPRASHRIAPPILPDAERSACLAPRRCFCQSGGMGLTCRAMGSVQCPSVIAPYVLWLRMITTGIAPDRAANPARYRTLREPRVPAVLLPIRRDGGSPAGWRVSVQCPSVIAPYVSRLRMVSKALHRILRANPDRCRALRAPRAAAVLLPIRRDGAHLPGDGCGAMPFGYCTLRVVVAHGLQGHCTRCFVVAISFDA
ncbi:MAG: hypothetical protein H6R19_1258, partial [Proteobacteria bacterium]|nr:hypothetical protein [Pseudomonadota bacterium]